MRLLTCMATVALQSRKSTILYDYPPISPLVGPYTRKQESNSDRRAGCSLLVTWVTTVAQPPARRSDLFAGPAKRASEGRVEPTATRTQTNNNPTNANNTKRRCCCCYTDGLGAQSRLPAPLGGGDLRLSLPPALLPTMQYWDGGGWGGAFLERELI